MSAGATPGPFDVLARVTGALERIGARYFVTGSLASSLHGEPRSTNDIDLVVELDARQAGALVRALGPEWYADPAAARAAATGAASFNAIHLASATKVDVFVLTAEPFEQERMRARQPVRLAGPPAIDTWVDAPEHAIVRKLEWFRRGGETSERQWRDVLGMLRAQAGRLDQTRLRHWAAEVGVTTLLERAIAETQHFG